MKEKVILCFFGVVSRSIKYTYKNLEENILNVLKEHFDVDIYVFNNNVENAYVDGTQQNNDDVTLLQRTFFEEKTQTSIDNDINNEITSKQINTRMRYDYVGDSVQNSLRQMYSENQVGLFLEKNKNKYKCAIVCGPDYFLLSKIIIEDVKNSINNDHVYTTQVNDAQGYTNGFYIGSLTPLIHILKRYTILELLLPTENDYEYLLKESFEIYKIQRIITDILFLKIRSNKNIARQGIMLHPFFDNIINNIKEIL